MIEFKPERLKEIRIVRKMTLRRLAEQLGISKQAVSKYECGRSVPHARAIFKMAQILNAPFLFFGKPSVVLENQSSILFFSKNANTPVKDIEYAGITSRWCYETLQGVHKLGESLAVNIPTLDDGLSIIDKAMALRKYWGLGISPIEDLTHVLEANGIIIATVENSDLNTGSYSQIINGIPIIILNRNRVIAVRQRFSLANELGHMILHKSISETDFILNGKNIENEARLFAISFLLPPYSFEHAVQTPTLQYFIDLKKKWLVSIADIMSQYINANISNAEHVEKVRNSFYKKFGKKFEPLDDVILPEIPTYLSRSLRERISDERSFRAFCDIVRLPTDDIEMLSGLAKGYLSQFYNDNANKVLFAGSNDLYPYEQLALFGMGV